MSGTKHVSGPWESFENPSTSNPAVRDVVGNIICDCNGSISYDVNMANARLISQAPAMLDALKTAAQGYEIVMRLLDKTLPGWRSGYMFAEVHRGMMEVIAKAEGGAS